jgi:hypothetical protein
VISLAVAASNIDVVNIPIGRQARWGALAVLGAAALAYAALRRRTLALGLHHALAALLVTLALVSTLWSPEPRLTLGRALALLAFLGTIAALAAGAAGRPRVAGQLLLGLLGAAAFVAVAGLVDLALQQDRALFPATTQSPARYSGLGGNPNTMPMVLAAALPPALWALREARSLAGRAAAAATALLFVGSILASGSRGALVAAAAGTLVYGLALAGSPSGRVLAVAGSALLVVVGAALMQLPQPAETNPVISPKIVPLPNVPFSEQEAQLRLPLESEIGFPKPGADPFRRSPLETSGRLPAWRGAAGQVAERPVAGYGFGTEEKVFVDRYYLFISDRVENSFLGTALQLGVVGLALLLGLLAAVARLGWRALLSLGGADRRVAAACAGAAVAGLVMSVTQSFLTSPGSPAAAPFWLSAFLLAALSGRPADAPPRVDQHERDEGEHEAADGHREAGLDVVRPQHGRVGEQEEGHPAGRAAPAEAEHEPGRRQHDQEPVDGG